MCRFLFYVQQHAVWSQCGQPVDLLHEYIVEKMISVPCITCFNQLNCFVFTEAVVSVVCSHWPKCYVSIIYTYLRMCDPEANLSLSFLCIVFVTNTTIPETELIIIHQRWV